MTFFNKLLVMIDGTSVRAHHPGIRNMPPNRAQGSFGRIVVDGHTPVGQEQAEGLLPREAIAERLGQIAFTGDAQSTLNLRRRYP
jgi:hypothetical protein